MIVSLFAAVLLIQTLLFIINAVGAKTINEIVRRTSTDTRSNILTAR